MSPAVNRIPWIPVIVSLPLFYGLSLMWLIPEGEKYVPGLVLVVFLIAIGVRVMRGRAEAAPSPLKVLTWLIVAYSAWSLGGYFTQGDSWTEIRAYVTAAFYGGALWLARPVRLDVRWLVAVLGLTFVIVAAYHLVMHGGARLRGYINPIPLAAVVAMTTVASAYLAAKAEQWRETGLWVLLIAALFVVLLLTQTRGVILAVLALAPLVAWAGSGWHWKGLAGVTGAAVVTVLLVFWVEPVQESVSQRYDRTLGELERLEAGDYGSSIGLRLQMLDAGARLTMVRPLVGLGSTHSDELQALADRGAVSQEIADFDPSHYHNAFVDITVKKGLIGLGLLFAVMVVSVRAGLRGGGALGVVVALGWLVYGLASLTDVPFRHPNAVYVLLFLALYAVSVSSVERRHGPQARVPPTG